MNHWNVFTPNIICKCIQLGSIGLSKYSHANKRDIEECMFVHFECRFFVFAYLQILLLTIVFIIMASGAAQLLNNVQNVYHFQCPRANIQNLQFSTSLQFHFFEERLHLVEPLLFVSSLFRAFSLFSFTLEKEKFSEWRQKVTVSIFRFKCRWWKCSILFRLLKPVSSSSDRDSRSPSLSGRSSRSHQSSRIPSVKGSRSSKTPESKSDGSSTSQTGKHTSVKFISKYISRLMIVGFLLDVLNTWKRNYATSIIWYFKLFKEIYLNSLATDQQA